MSFRTARMLLRREPAISVDVLRLTTIPTTRRLTSVTSTRSRPPRACRKGPCSPTPATRRSHDHARKLIPRFQRRHDSFLRLRGHYSKAELPPCGSPDRVLRRAPESVWITLWISRRPAPPLAKAHCRDVARPAEGSFTPLIFMGFIETKRVPEPYSETLFHPLSERRFMCTTLGTSWTFFSSSPLRGNDGCRRALRRRESERSRSG